MTRPDQYSNVIDHYQSILESGAQGAQAVGWGSTASQNKRFETLSEIASLDSASILDVGCGTGALLEWLTTQELKTNYSGVDITPAMVSLAKSRYPHARFALGSVNPLPNKFKGDTFDYVFASGIFYKDVTNGIDGLRRTVEDMYSLCEKGVAFNSLSSLHTSKDAEELYVEPGILADIAGALTPKFNLRHDYHNGDVTIHLYKV